MIASTHLPPTDQISPISRVAEKLEKIVFLPSFAYPSISSSSYIFRPVPDKLNFDEGGRACVTYVPPYRTLSSSTL